jgi:hypothetical protein
MKAWLFAVLWCIQILSAWAENDRIWIEATINDKPARFVLDTGSPKFYTLYRKSAERLGIAVTNFSSNSISTNDVWAGYTGINDLKIGDSSLSTWFWVLDSPMDSTRLTGDGIIGWPTLTNCVAMIDAKAGMAVRFQSVPVDTNGWIRLPIETGADYLRLIVRKSDGSRAVLVVDSGADLGVKLNSKLWKEWKSSHTNPPTTLMANFNFSEGMVTSEEDWAKQISFGPLTLTEVPVMQASSIDLELGGTNFEATLGLAALKRLDLIVDAMNGVAYLRPKTEKAPRHKQSRTGMTFTTPDLKSSEWIARVITGSPAYNVGIRDGDMLLKVNGTKIESFDELSRMAEQVSEQPSGTAVDLTLKRGEKVFETKIVLRDISEP